jgi:uncharacterized membrane protein YhaH (DUF805 family)
MFINLFTDNLQNAGYWILAIYVLNFFIAIAILYLERWDSSATWAWLTVLFLLPVVGIVLYLVSSGQRKGLSEKELEEGVFGEHTH